MLLLVQVNFSNHLFTVVRPSVFWSVYPSVNSKMFKYRTNPLLQKGENRMCVIKKNQSSSQELMHKKCQY